MDNIEKQVAQGIAAASGLSISKLGLRLDKVVLWLFEDLRSSLAESLVNDEAIIVTITAPIKVPTKTKQEIEACVRELLRSGIRHRTINIFQNEVSIRIVGTSSKQAPRLIGLVHNPDIDPTLLLDLAAKWLRQY